MDEPLPDDVGASPEPTRSDAAEHAAPAARSTASVSPPRGRVPRRRRTPARGCVEEMLTITLGVLIALALDGLKDWLQSQRLLATARTAIERELRDNLEEVEIVAATAAQREEKLTQALRLASDLIENENSTVQEVDLGFEIAEVSSASFETATRNGALALMEYDEARRYARAYEAQDRFVEHQGRLLAELEAAASNMTADPYGALPGDIQRFREHVMAMAAMLNIERQLVARLAESYREAMEGERPSSSGS